MWQLVLRPTKTKMGMMMLNYLCMMRNYLRTLLNMSTMCYRNNLQVEVSSTVPVNGKLVLLSGSQGHLQRNHSTTFVCTISISNSYLLLTWLLFVRIVFQLPFLNLFC